MKTSIPLIINGEAVNPPKTFAVVNPATGEPFASVAAGDVSHLDAGVAAARAAFPSWKNTPDEQRQSLLHAIGDALEKNMPALMEIVTKETGKPWNGLNGVGAGMEVGGSV